MARETLDRLLRERDDYKAHFEACERARVTLLAERDELREALRDEHGATAIHEREHPDCYVCALLSRHPVLPGKGTL